MLESLIRILNSVGKITELYESHDGSRVLILPHGGRILIETKNLKADESFVRITFLEMPDAPRIQRENLFFNDPAQFLFPAAFQLNKILSFLIAAEIRRLIETRRWPHILFREAACAAKSVRAIHFQVDRD